jgi:hypothetical protein
MPEENDDALQLNEKEEQTDVLDESVVIISESNFNINSKEFKP